MLKAFSNSLTFRLSLLLILTVLATWLYIHQEWVWFGVTVAGWLVAIRSVRKRYTYHAQKVAFMFDAIDNGDYAFKYATNKRFSNDKLVNQSLNRITKILLDAKADAVQKEKYYELILNSIRTGFIVIDEKGYVYQTNNEALRLLGLSVFTHVKQLRRIDEKLAELIVHIPPGSQQQISFTNERGTVHLSFKVSAMTLREKYVRIIAINDINSELDNKEIDSWIRLTRVLTHEIMNSITPITSLSETLLSIHSDANKEIRDGLEIIGTTGKSLITFVDSYRKFAHIPTPVPSLFYVKKFSERMVQLASHHNHYPDISFRIDVQPENLIGQVMLNLLKNAMQAIGKDRKDGRIEVKAYCNENEAILIEVTNNGPLIPLEEIGHIFVPFYTTKENGSGVGLSISRQIMRLSGGSIVLNINYPEKTTTFTLIFP